jgi:pentatricopeptide repeat-containing protein PET309
LGNPLIQYLSKSNRIVDAERITDVFEILDPDHRDAAAYKSAICAYLKLQNVPDAMQLHESALESLDIPAGSNELLAHLVETSSWTRATALWKQTQKFIKTHPSAQNYTLYEILDTVPKLGSLAYNLAEYANERVASPLESEPGEIVDLLDFASSLIQRVLLRSHSFNSATFNVLLQTLQQWGRDTPLLYQKITDSLLQIKETKLAVKCYRRARQSDNAYFTPKTLHSILEIFCKYHSILGMQQVLDDFFRMHRKPSRFAYKLCMSEFAFQGDAQSVRALFSQFVSRFADENGKALSSGNELAPILNVHAKRGEIDKVVAEFSQMESVHGVAPTLLCWNILISAYGKVYDIDGAYRAFEEILNHPSLRPDGYTFGTMMGIGALRGDTSLVIDLYRLAEDLKIQKNIAMLDALVISHCQEDDIASAERICEDALGMKLTRPRTRMWNYLLVAYANRRDLSGVNRILQRMSEADVDYDQYTYSALMQALCMVKQPNRAKKILTDVMPEAGVPATAFHYAVVMGGFIGTGQSAMVFEMQKRMYERDLQGSASVDSIAVKALALEDQQLLDETSDEALLPRAMEMFQNLITTLDTQKIASTTRKGAGQIPLDIAYPTMLYSYVMFVLGQREQFGTVEALYTAFKSSIPEKRQQNPPLNILSALMATKLRQRDHQGVEECWQLALSQAKEAGTPLKDTLGTDLDRRAGAEVLWARQLDLSRHLTFYMRSLFFQNKADKLIETIKNFQGEGFVMDNHNINHYIVLLARSFRFRLAFQLCEEHLMDRWTGWARDRWAGPGRNRLPIELRRARKHQRFFRPLHRTLLWLARGYMEIEAQAVESRASESMINWLGRECPKTVQAIKSMHRTDEDLERAILRGT